MTTTTNTAVGTAPMTASRAAARLDELRDAVACGPATDLPRDAEHCDAAAAAETALAEHWCAISRAACEPGGVLDGVDDPDVRSLLIQGAVYAASYHQRSATDWRIEARSLRRAQR